MQVNLAEVHMRIDPYFEGIPASPRLTVKIEKLRPWIGEVISQSYWCVVGGAIDSKYANAIKKGILQKMEEGPRPVLYCQNIRVCIYDGKMSVLIPMIYFYVGVFSMP
ncbi:MAG: hypothetical protein IPN72_08785 [Saprospiraceae bacterium]|nr:hypothetical protein [Saprospiraceae bacterium]